MVGVKTVADLAIVAAEIVTLPEVLTVGAKTVADIVFVVAATVAVRVIVGVGSVAAAVSAAGVTVADAVIVGVGLVADIVFAGGVAVALGDDAALMANESVILPYVVLMLTVLVALLVPVAPELDSARDAEPLLAQPLVASLCSVIPPGAVQELDAPEIIQ